ncbi:unnamed protein product [Zymoseptoria tritici ST99CH_1A5]|uniref:Zn(2)-C6 fungal-type domain-containing protein n=1 Tax=Zymoseptoria tritici ST99CH_1A5 TaxID=1276529 RepID=A0A1Y6LEY9_ZYMTR|nr:unnamed protein product [Zymoseptoria tritici ST99CH_1A5]
MTGRTAPATRRSVKKSRGGCTRCKAQHLKCDEKKPECGRCERLGVGCPGYAQPLKWSYKHEVGQPGFSAQSPATAAVQTPREFHFSPSSAMAELDWTDLMFQPMLDSVPPAPTETILEPVRQLDWNTATPVNAFPSWATGGDDTISQNDAVILHSTSSRSPVRRKQSMLQSLQSHRPELPPQVPRSLSHQSTELISYYFKEVPRVYSMFDSMKNPFRSAVSELFGHSLIVNLAAQSMAAGFLVEVHPRFAKIGRNLRREAMELIKKEDSTDYKALLALSMFGPTGNWLDASDLGVEFYNMARDRIEAIRSSDTVMVANDNNFKFFDEGLVFWECILAYVVDGDLIRPAQPSLEIQHPNISMKRAAHPWTGVAREMVQTVADIGRLVRAHRSRLRKQTFVTQVCLDQLGHDLLVAKEFEKRILAYQLPDEESILDLEDEATPIHHLITMAEVNRYAGLLQLYRVFPDLLTDRLAAEDGAMDHWTGSTNTGLPANGTRNSQWLTAFAIEALRLLESVPIESGTRDFHPFMLVLCSSELTCTSMNELSASNPSESHDEELNETFIEVSMVRKFVLDRLTTCLSLLPPTPIRVCIDIVKETWKRIDAGQKDVYWLDVMMERGWETIMA